MESPRGDPLDKRDTPGGHSPPAADVQGVPNGVTCLACGYDLHGLDPVGDCPECGAPIAFSMRADLYRFTDVDRLRRMAFGATLVGVSILLAAPAAFALRVLDELFHSARMTGTISSAGAIVWVIAHALGWWMMSEREPVGVNADTLGAGGVRGERARVWLREAVAFFVLATLGAISADLARTIAWGSVSPFLPGRRLAAALWLAAIVAGVGVLLTGMRYMMAMARRLPPGKLGARAEFLFVLVATISGMMAASAAVGGVFYGLGMPEAVGFLGGTCGCMSVPLWIVALIGVMMAAHAAAAALRIERIIGLELRRERGRASLP